MSSGADCQFIEKEPGRWTVKLQRWPYGDTDEYDTFGPFRSYSAAVAELNNHQNPGGWMTRIHPTAHVHEWETERGAYVPAGVEVTVRIESLGINPTPAAILALFRRPSTKGGLNKDHLRIKPVTRFDQSASITSCVACGEERTK